MSLSIFFFEPPKSGRSKSPLKFLGLLRWSKCQIRARHNGQSTFFLLLPIFQWDITNFVLDNSLSNFKSSIKLFLHLHFAGSDDQNVKSGLFFRIFFTFRQLILDMGVFIRFMGSLDCDCMGEFIFRLLEKTLFKKAERPKLFGMD